MWVQKCLLRKVFAFVIRLKKKRKKKKPKQTRNSLIIHTLKRTGPRWTIKYFSICL